ncbi:AraC family transcriptional regulator [Comamonas humi]
MRDRVQYSRATELPGLVLSTARFSAFRFEPHYHLDCHIALVTDGVQRQSFKGESLVLARGAIQLMPAGEVHDGIAGADETYTLQTFRLSPALLKGLGEEITGRHNLPSQASMVLHDLQLADQLARLHVALQSASASPLLKETQVIELFESLFARLLRPMPQSFVGKLTARQLMQVRDYMEAHLSDKVSLDDLARMLDLDRFRFLKLFKRTVGMTPHAWLLRWRLEKAVELIKMQHGVPMADVAYAVGFFDQSHFTNAFRRAYGVTPTRFQRPSGNFLQDDGALEG